MSRSGYSEDLDQWALIKWRGQVASAIRGKRGQAFLRELLAALDAMPEKRLIARDLQNAQGEVCTLGCIAVARGVPVTDYDVEDDDHREALGATLGIAHQLIAEIEFENDEQWFRTETPEQRWARMRQWVASQIVANTAPNVSQSSTPHESAPEGTSA